MTDDAHKISIPSNSMPDNIKNQTIPYSHVRYVFFNDGFVGYNDNLKLAKMLDKESWDYLRMKIRNNEPMTEEFQIFLLDKIDPGLFTRAILTTQTPLLVSSLHKLMTRNQKNKNYLALACKSLEKNIVRQYFAADSLLESGETGTSTIWILLNSDYEIDESFFNYVIQHAAPMETNAKTIKEMVSRGYDFSDESVSLLIKKSIYGYSDDFFEEKMNALTEISINGNAPRTSEKSKRNILLHCPSTINNLAADNYIPHRDDFPLLLERGKLDSQDLAQFKKSNPNFEINVGRNSTIVSGSPAYNYEVKEFSLTMGLRVSAFVVATPYIKTENPMRLMTEVARAAKKAGNEIDKKSQGRMWWLAHSIGVKPDLTYDYVFFGKMPNPAECADAGFYPTDLIAFDAIIQDTELLAKLARAGWGSIHINKMIDVIVNDYNKKMKRKPMTEQDKEKMRNHLLYGFISARRDYLQANGGVDVAANARKAESNRIQDEFRQRDAKRAQAEQTLKDRQEQIRKTREAEQKRQREGTEKKPTFGDLFGDLLKDLNTHEK